MSSQTSLDTIHQFLAQKRMAMIGISRQPSSFSMMLFQELWRCGYEVIPVNPNTPNVCGHPCFARIQDIHPPVDAALLITSPQVTESVVADCACAGIRLVWMHRGVGTGSVSSKALTFCRAQGINVIAGECPFMFLPSGTGVHNLHRFFRKMTGRYPRARNVA